MAELATDPIWQALQHTAEIEPLSIPRPLCLAEQLPSGRLIELSGGAGSARTTTAVSLVIRCQALGEPVAWIQPEGGALYPPDLAESGVDLASLAVIQVPTDQVRSPLRPQIKADTPGNQSSRGANELARAAELLLRSGAFGLVVLDLSDGAPSRAAWQSRLGGLARQHGSQLVLLTRSDSGKPSSGPMVMVRIEPRRERCAPGRFSLAHQVLKNKTAGTVAPGPDRHRGPAGLP